MSAKTVSFDIFNVLLNYAKSNNINADNLLKSIQFNRELLDNRSARIPAHQYHKLWQFVVAESDDKNFGLHFGLGTNDFCRGSVLCSIMMNCSTINDAIQKFIKYYRLLSDLIIPELKIKSTIAFFTFNRRPGIVLDKHQMGSYLIMLNSVLHCLGGFDIKISEIRFMYQRPADISEHKRIFEVPLIFDHDRNEIVFHKKDLSIH